jgi:hypothetical protein
MARTCPTTGEPSSLPDDDMIAAVKSGQTGIWRRLLRIAVEWSCQTGWS